MFFSPFIRFWLAGLALISTGLGFISPVSAETISVGGRVIENAEIAEVTESGLQYKTPEGKVVVPWVELNQFQKAAVHGRFSEALENLRLKAIWVEGTVFERHKDGVVVQISLDLTPGVEPESADAPHETEWKNGGEVAKGMVMVKDLKDSAIKKEGEPVSGIFYKVGTYTYEVGGFNLIKEIALCSQFKPEWAVEREWTNLEGRSIRARVVAVKEGKCLFDQGGKTFPYAIDQLSDPDQALIKAFEERSRLVPLP